MMRLFGVEGYCSHWYLQRTFTITVLSCVIILPLCLAKTLDFLKYPSTIGVFAMTYLMVVIVIDYFLQGPTHNVQIVYALEAIIEKFHILF